MLHREFWYGFVVPWIGFALFMAEFSPKWGTDGPYVRRLAAGLVAGFIFAGGTYLTRRFANRLLRSVVRRKQAPPAA